MSPVKRVDRGRDERGPRALESCQAQPPGARLHVGSEIAFGVRDAAQDRPRMGKQQLARLGQPRALAIAFDQRRSRLSLERRDLLADRRLRVGEGIGGGRERTPLCEGAQDHEALGIEH